MTRALIGHSGLLGHRVLARWYERGFTARLLCRSYVAVACARLGHSVVVMGNFFDAGVPRELIHGCDLMVNLATALKALNGTVDWAANNRVHREGTLCMLKACLGSGARRLVQQSVAFVEEGPDVAPGGGLAHELASGQATAFIAVVGHEPIASGAPIGGTDHDAVDAGHIDRCAVRVVAASPTVRAAAQGG